MSSKVIIHDTGDVVFCSIVVSWGKVITGLDPRTIEDSTRYATRPVWIVQQKITRRNITAIGKAGESQVNEARRMNF